jgi:protein involved in temperature-dependent protein secretion
VQERLLKAMTVDEALALFRDEVRADPGQRVS